MVFAGAELPQRRVYVDKQTTLQGGHHLRGKSQAPPGFPAKTQQRFARIHITILLYILSCAMSGGELPREPVRVQHDHQLHPEKDALQRLPERIITGGARGPQRSGG